MMTMMDVQTNWRRWTAWSAGNGLPDPSEAIILPADLMRTVLITEPFIVQELRDWLAAHSRQAIKFYGRFDITVHRFRVDRELIGLNLRFADEDEALYAKLRWS